MAVCKWCKKEMLKAESCKFPFIKINGKWYKRDVTYFGENEGRCGDCGIQINGKNNHHFGCDVERCPRCKRQLLSCDCKVEELGRKK